MKGYAAQGLSYPAARQRFLQEKTGWSEKNAVSGCSRAIFWGQSTGRQYGF